MTDFHIVEGFDLYNGVGANTGIMTNWSNVSSGGAITMQAGRFGGQCVRLQDGSGDSSHLRRQWPTTSSNFSVGLAVMQSRFDLIGNQPFFRIESATGTQLSLYMAGATGVVTAYRGLGTTALIASAAGAMTQAVWAYIEFFGSIHQTTGHLELWINGVQAGTFDGDTAALAGITYDGVLLSGQDGSGSSSFTSIDDLFVANVATRIGEARIETLRPVADTADKDWVPSTASTNYDDVDDTTASTAEYVDGAAVNDLDLYDLADLSSNPASVYAVKPKIFAAKTDAMTRKIATVLQSNAVDSQSADIVLAASAQGFDVPALDLNPDGSIAWTFGAVNALKLGQKVTV